MIARLEHHGVAVLNSLSHHLLQMLHGLLGVCQRVVGVGLLCNSERVALERSMHDLAIGLSFFSDMGSQNRVRDLDCVMV